MGAASRAVPLVLAVLVLTGCATTGRYTELPALRVLHDVHVLPHDSELTTHGPGTVALVRTLARATPLPVERLQVASSSAANRAVKKERFARSNAYAFRCGPDPKSDAKPWGCIVIGDQLLQGFAEEALAGVIAHELGHLERGHGPMKREGQVLTAVNTAGRILSWVPGPLGWAGAAMSWGTVGAEVWLLTYTRDHEREADAAAIARLAAAGYCAGPTLRATFEALARFGQRQLQIQETASSPESAAPSSSHGSHGQLEHPQPKGQAAMTGGGGIFSSHPSLEERWKNASDSCSGTDVLRSSP